MTGPCTSGWWRLAAMGLLVMTAAVTAQVEDIALGKTAFQTSTRFDRGAVLAVDGDTDTNWYNGSCTHTENEDNPAWWVDLGQSYPINRVVIFNRQDCCSDRLNPFEIYIGDSIQVTSNSKCGGDHRIDVNQSSIAINCQGITGRYVGVRLPGTLRELTLCEVQVYQDKDIAQGMQAYQTSTRFDKAATLAVDGDINGDFDRGSCTHTENEDDPAWWVDLGKSYPINRVVIFNRLDCCSDRLNPFNVYIGDSDQVTSNPQCGGTYRIGRQASISIFCQGMTGRYVGIRLPGTLRELTLCEVQVFQDNDLALGKPAFQTSINFGGVPGRAVDGDINGDFYQGSCTHTQNQDNPAWWVDLGASIFIDRVVIFNRLDCCSERINPFNIHIGDSELVSSNSQCGGNHQIAANQSFISVSCGMRGRYVTVRLPGTLRELTMCEVQVFQGSLLIPSEATIGRSLGAAWAIALLNVFVVLVNNMADLA